MEQYSKQTAESRAFSWISWQCFAAMKFAYRHRARPRHGRKKPSWEASREANREKARELVLDILLQGCHCCEPFIGLGENSLALHKFLLFPRLFNNLLCLVSSSLQDSTRITLRPVVTPNREGSRISPKKFQRCEYVYGSLYELRRTTSRANLTRCKEKALRHVTAAAATRRRCPAMNSRGWLHYNGLSLSPGCAYTRAHIA